MFSRLQNMIHYLVGDVHDIVGDVHDDVIEVFYLYDDEDKARRKVVLQCSLAFKTKIIDFLHFHRSTFTKVPVDYGKHCGMI